MPPDVSHADTRAPIIMPQSFSRSVLPAATLSVLLLGACADVVTSAPDPTANLSRAHTTEASGTVSVVMSGLNAPKQMARCT